MLYPSNIKVECKIKSIKEKWQDLKNGIKRKVKYLIYNRNNLSKIILVKLHI